MCLEVGRDECRGRTSGEEGSVRVPSETFPSRHDTGDFHSDLWLGARPVRCGWDPGQESPEWGL